MLRDNEILVKRRRDLANIDRMEIFRNTGIGVVKERGMGMGEVAVEDKVAWAGIPAADEIIVPGYLFARIPDGLKDEVAVFGGIGGFVIQAVRETGLTFGEKVVVLGHGVLRSIVSQVVALFGIHELELAYATESETEIDGVFLCPGGETDVGLMANRLRDKAPLLVLTEDYADIPLKLLAEKQARLIFPGQPRLETRDLCYPASYMRWTIKEDLRLFLKLLGARKVEIKEGNQ